MKRILSLLFVALFSFAVHAQHSAVTPDPYYINDNGLNCDYSTTCQAPSHSTSGKTLRSQDLNPASVNCIFLTWGQSNVGNTSPNGYAATNAANIDNLNPYDGAIYSGNDPQVGVQTASALPPGGGHFMVPLADQLIGNGKCSRVIFEPINANGSTIGIWESIPVVQGRLPVAVKRIIQRGIQCGTTNVHCVMLIGIGESDCGQGTSKASFMASFTNVLAGATSAGFVGRILIAKETWTSATTCSNLQDAQTLTTPSGLINNAAGIYVGANADALLGSICTGGLPCRQADNLHFSDAGLKSYATDVTYGWFQALHASGLPF